MIRRQVLLSLFAATVAPRALAQSRPLLKPPAPQPGEAALIESAGLHGEVAYAVRDASGAILEAQNADLALPPASTLKTVTALYALDRLGAGHRFTTRVLLAGDTLIFAGGGDPVLDSDRLAVLARDAADALAGRSPPARLAVWGGALPRIGQLDPAQAAHLPYNPTISGMILNFNRVHIGWRAGGQGMALEARGEAISPAARTISAAITDRRLPLFDWSEVPEGEHWAVARAGVDAPGSRWLPVRRPELYAGDAFRSLARGAGLTLPAAEEIAELPPDAAEIARSDSPDLSTILRDMLAFSTNLTAEVLGLAASGIGAKDPGGAGAVARSAGLMRDWALAALPGSGIEAAHFADHSGLSAESRVTAAGMSALMAGPGRARGLRTLLKDVTLTDRKGRPRAARVRVLAKSGTLNFVSNLAGYAARIEAPGRPDGRDLAFAILTADPARRAASEGEELPDGLIGWTGRARNLQGRLIEGWSAEWGAPVLPPETALRG